jgi:hypothetical protein
MEFTVRTLPNGSLIIRPSGTAIRITANPSGRILYEGSNNGTPIKKTWSDLDYETIEVTVIS